MSICTVFPISIQIYQLISIGQILFCLLRWAARSRIHWLCNSKLPCHFWPKIICELRMWLGTHRDPLINYKNIYDFPQVYCGQNILNSKMASLEIFDGESPQQTDHVWFPFLPRVGRGHSFEWPTYCTDDHKVLSTVPIILGRYRTWWLWVRGKNACGVGVVLVKGKRDRGVWWPTI